MTTPAGVYHLSTEQLTFFETVVAVAVAVAVTVTVTVTVAPDVSVIAETAVMKVQVMATEVAG